MGNKFWLFTVFILLIGLTNQQAGGGRSSGGSSSFSGSRSTYYGPSYYGSSYYGNRYYSCQEKCYGSPYPNCIPDCEKQNSASGAIAGGIVGGICLAFCAACVSCMCCSANKSCYCHKYQELKRLYNHVDDHSMPESQYIYKRDKIIGLLNSSKSMQNFKLEQGVNKYPMSAHVQIVKQEPFKTELELQGDDQFGAWTANGFILCRNGEIFFWMYKEYNNKEQAGQTGDYQHLVYQSRNFDEYQGMQGVWFYTGFENSTLYSGEWRLMTQSQSQPMAPPNQAPNFMQNSTGQNQNYFNPANPVNPQYQMY